MISLSGRPILTKPRVAPSDGQPLSLGKTDDLNLDGPRPEAIARSSPARGELDVLRGAAALLSTQPITWAVSLLATIMLPRFLGDEGLGYYAVATTIAAIAGTVGTLGIPFVLVRDIANDASCAHEDGPASVVLVTVVGLLMLGLVSLALPLSSVSANQHLLISLALVGMVGTLGNRVLTSVLNGQAKHAKQAWLNAAGTAGGTLAGLITLMFGGTAASFLVASAAVAALASIVGWQMCRFRLDRSTFRLLIWVRLVRRGGPFLGWNVAMQIRNQIDVVLVAFLLGADAAGWLAAAYRIVFIPIFLPVVITTPLLPVLSRVVDDRPAFQRTLRQGFKSVLVLTVPASAMVMAIAPDIPSLLHWGASFQHSVLLMMLLAIDQPLGAIDMVLSAGLMALRRERRWLVVGVTAAAFNPLANLVLLPLARGWMDNAAAAACAIEVCTELIMMGGALMLLPRRIIGRSEASLAARIGVAAVALIVTARAVLPLSPVGAVVTGGVTFVILAALLQVITLHEVREFIFVARSTILRRTAGTVVR